MCATRYSLEHYFFFSSAVSFCFINVIELFYWKFGWNYHHFDNKTQRDLDSCFERSGVHSFRQSKNLFAGYSFEMKVTRKCRILRLVKGLNTVSGGMKSVKYLFRYGIWFVKAVKMTSTWKLFLLRQQIYI